MLITKKCFKCNKTKPIKSFYKHKQMLDGHLNKCKECAKNDARLHRDNNINKVREYDRNRPNAQERSEKNCKRVKNYSESQKRKYDENRRTWGDIQHNKNKKTVNMYLANAVRGNRIIKPLFCEHCNNSGIALEGHHSNYLEPLNVVWLCKPCHGKEHKRLNEIARNKKDYFNKKHK